VWFHVILLRGVATQIFLRQLRAPTTGACCGTTPDGMLALRGSGRSLRRR
jgi:hypothetical protein